MLPPLSEFFEAPQHCRWLHQHHQLAPHPAERWWRRGQIGNSNIPMWAVQTMTDIL